MVGFLEYLHAAMRLGLYERLDESATWFAYIPGFEGLWATGPTIEEAREELWNALDGWLYVNAFVSQLPLPGLGRIHSAR